MRYGLPSNTDVGSWISTLNRVILILALPTSLTSQVLLSNTSNLPIIVFRFDSMPQTIKEKMGGGWEVTGKIIVVPLLVVLEKNKVFLVSKSSK